MILVGWLSGSGLLPIHPLIKYSDANLKFIKVWIQLAVTIGLILPTVAWLVWFKYSESRIIFGFYLLLLVTQIATEQIVSSVWLPSLVVVTGTLYTLFRVWQLWQGLQQMKTSPPQSARSATSKKPQQKLASGILWLLLLFWSGNLIVLLTIAWPSIL